MSDPNRTVRIIAVACAPAILGMLLILAILAFPTSTPAAKPDPMIARVAALEARVDSLNGRLEAIGTQLDMSFEEVYDHLNYLKLHVELIELKADQPDVVMRHEQQEAKFAGVAPR